MKYFIKSFVFLNLLFTSTAFTNEKLDQALWAASNKGNLSKVKELIEQGADPNAQDEDGSTPLHWGAMWGHLEVVKFLVSKGSDPNARNEYGETPLQRGAWGGNLEVVKYLISKGSDPNARNEYGETPLHAGAYWDSEQLGELSTERKQSKLKVLQYLIQKGDDPFLKDSEGKTARDLANDSKLWEIRDFLQNIEDSLKK